jgi:GNAT superfamily N-acetyltransferase
MTHLLYLNDDQLAALRDVGVGTARHDDLSSAYAFPHALNKSGALKKGILEGNRPSRFRWWVLLRDGDGRCLFEGETPLARRVGQAMSLASGAVSSGSGAATIAFNDQLKIEPTLRGKGLARAIYDAEEALYRRWGVREIQIPMAQDDGLVVWIKKFGFLPQDPRTLAADYNDWPGSRSAGPVSTPAGYPEQFLRTQGTLALYKRL